jgi:hypothetical protein
MALPPNIRVNVQVPFPALVTGAGSISIAKASGIWTVSLNATLAAAAIYPLLPTFSATNAPNTRTTSTYTVAPTDTTIIADFAGTTTLTLPTPNANTGRQLLIKTILAQTVVSAASNVVPLTGGAAATAILAATIGKWALMICDGTNWIIMAAN